MADHGNNELHQNPLFIVKGMNEKHEFIISEKRVTYEDMQSVLIELKAGKKAEEAVSDSGAKERVFYFYNDSHLKEDSYSEDIIEYKSLGHAKDGEAMVETGVLYERW